MFMTTGSYLSVKGNNTAPVMAWQGKLSEEIVEELRNELLDALREAECLTINLAGVESLDIPCLLLLCATKRYTDSMGQTFHLEGADNPAVVKVVGQYDCGAKSYCLAPCHEHCLWGKKMSSPAGVSSRAKVTKGVVTWLRKS